MIPLSIFVNSFSKYLLTTYYMVSTVLDDEDMIVNKTKSLLNRIGILEVEKHYR